MEEEELKEEEVKEDEVEGRATSLIWLVSRGSMVNIPLSLAEIALLAYISH